MPSMREHSPRQRVISLAPSITSILLALGARRHIVAVSKWCKDVADVNGLPALGDCWSLGTRGGNKENAASLLELNPTLIIGSVPFTTETVQQILALPVPFLALNPRSLADIEMDIRTLSLLTSAKSRAEALIGEMRGTFEHIRKAASRAKSRPRVYCEAWPNPRISSPPWVAELVEICGGQMCVSAGARVSGGDVARANPEIIVLAWTAVGGKSKPEQALRNAAWSGVTAVREKRVFAIRDELLNTPGPPLMRGAEELLRVIHPEVGAPQSKSRKFAKAAVS